MLYGGQGHQHVSLGIDRELEGEWAHGYCVLLSVVMLNNLP